MFKNYLKVAARNLYKHKAYSLVTIIGLAVGLAATLLILLYIRFESSYDTFHRQADSLFRVSVVYKKEGRVEFDGPQFTPPIGPAMLREFPEVENYVRLSSERGANLSYEEKTMKVEGIIHADSTFFDLFSFTLTTGNPQRALTNPYSIVLTEELARRLFGTESPVGRMIQLDHKESYLVAGVAEAPPANSHIQFNALISFSTLYKDPHRFMDWNGGNQYITYVKLRQNAPAAEVERKFPDFMWRHINSQLAPLAVSLEPYLQLFSKIHLHYDYGSSSLRTSLYIFSAVALLILGIACVNFVNLTTARATRRAKEVGVRKVLGASRRALIRQFLTESMLLTLLALLVGLFLIELVFPLYQQVVGRDLRSVLSLNIADIGAIAGIVLLVGIVGGSYPAFFLSSLQTIQTLKGTFPTSTTVGKTRNLLVIVQFAISIALIICTIIVIRQLDYARQKELGFDKEQVVIVPMTGDDVQLSSERLKAGLREVPGVVAVTASSEVPYRGFTSNGYFPEGFDKPMMIHVVDVDESFLSTYGIPLASGRNFSRELPTDKRAYLINETLARSLNWEDPIGKKITRNGAHTVIGVVKDFHFATLHSKIEPLIITNEPWLDRFSLLSVKISPSDIPATLKAINTVWQGVTPGTPFDYWFLDEAFDHLYRLEEQFERIFLSFSFLAIVIAVLGLLSLASLAAEQRTKEIGIRKVLGSSVPAIMSLLSKDFVKLVLVANILAWPAAYYFMSRWLENFAYRVDIEWWVFVLAGILALLIALMTVSVRAIRAALANPVEALRYE